MQTLKQLLHEQTVATTKVMKTLCKTLLTYSGNDNLFWLTLQCCHLMGSVKSELVQVKGQIKVYLLTISLIHEGFLNSVHSALFVRSVPCRRNKGQMKLFVGGLRRLWALYGFGCDIIFSMHQILSFLLNVKNTTIKIMRQVKLIITLEIMQMKRKLPVLWYSWNSTDQQNQPG